jgi:hypothetical protein
MVVNPLISIAFLALGYGTAVVCRRYGWFARWNFVLLMLAAVIAEVVVFSFALSFFMAFKS